MQAQACINLRIIILNKNRGVTTMDFCPPPPKKKKIV